MKKFCWTWWLDGSGLGKLHLSFSLWTAWVNQTAWTNKMGRCTWTEIQRLKDWYFVSWFLKWVIKEHVVYKDQVVRVSCRWSRMSSCVNWCDHWAEGGQTVATIPHYLWAMGRLVMLVITVVRWLSVYHGWMNCNRARGISAAGETLSVLLAATLLSPVITFLLSNWHL